MPKTGTTARPAATKKNNSKPAAAAPAKAPAKPPASAGGPSGAALEIRTRVPAGRTMFQITEGAIRASDLKKIKTDDPDDPGLLSYDPAFLNTASCRSAITYIDGDKGILRYRGYPIEQLAEKRDVPRGGLAASTRRAAEPAGVRPVRARHHVSHVRAREHAEVPRGIPLRRASDGDAQQLRRGARVVLSDVAQHFRRAERNISIIRLLAKVPTIAAFCYRHVKGLPFVYPDNDLSYVENFLSMVARMTEPKYEANPMFARALEVLFILHADHEQNCSTNAVRAVGSSHVDPFSAMSAGIAALFGPLHGGANEQVLRMITEIGTVKNVPQFIEERERREGGKLMGFGHRVYKSYDPRAKIVKKLADEVFKVVGVDKDLEIALELERIALSDDYFMSRKLYPNVDFYTGLIYRSMAFPTDFFTVLFAIATQAGWLAQWEEMLLDKEQKIARPRQIYIGPAERPYRSKLKAKQTL